MPNIGMYPEKGFEKVLKSVAKKPAPNQLCRIPKRWTPKSVKFENKVPASLYPRIMVPTKYVSFSVDQGIQSKFMPATGKLDRNIKTIHLP